jgi:hypothetical protein
MDVQPIEIAAAITYVWHIFQFSQYLILRLKTDLMIKTLW